MPLFQNPAVLMAMYDPVFRGGEFSPYPWQVEALAEFARDPNPPVQMNMVCPNGGGKSSLMIAAAATWPAVEFMEAQVGVTSSSGAQLDLQSFRSINRMANFMNTYHDCELWDMHYRSLTFRPTGSRIDARQTDEEGKMEGMHPMVPGGEFAILVDEGKSISEAIYAAIIKWTGFTRRLDISSAGEPAGTFYNNHVSGRWWARKITADQCPHISDATKREIIATYGENHPMTRAILYSEFTSTAGSLVMTYETVQTAIRMALKNEIRHVKTPLNRAGVDLSGGGDEFCMSVWNGNKQLALETLQTQNAVDQANEIIRLTEKWSLPEDARFADAGGLGKAILDICARRGCPWIRVYNQSRPITMAAKNYGNRGTEMWVHFAKLMHDAKLILLEDSRQKNQLANRYYIQQASSDKIILEPKKQAIAKGHPSPDRADATVLANCRYRPEEEAAEGEETPKGKNRKYNLDQLRDLYEDMMEGEEDALEYGKKHLGTITMEHVTGERRL